MPLHTQVEESSQDDELDVNPVYVRELSCEIPRYRLPQHGMLPRTALQMVRDELILDGNARLNLAIVAIVWLASGRVGLIASRLSVVRTVVTCLLALALSYLGSRSKRVELRWVAYAAVAFGALKLLFEDLRFGNAGSLVV